MKKPWRLIAVAATLVLALAFLAHYSYLLLYEDLREYRTYRVAFDRTQGLRKGDDIFVQGYRAGRVHDVGLSGDHQVAHLQLEPWLTLHRRGLVVEVKTIDSFGTAAIDIDPGEVDSGDWPPESEIPGSVQGGFGAVSDDASAPSTFSELVRNMSDITTTLTRTDGTAGRFLNDPDLAVGIQDGFVGFEAGTRGLRDGIARVASGDGPGGLLVRDPQIEIDQASRGVRERLEAIEEGLSEAATGQGGRFGARLLGDRDAAAHMRERLERRAQDLESYRMGDGAAVVFTHAPEPGEALLGRVDRFADLTGKAVLGEGRPGALLGPDSGEGVRGALTLLESRFAEARGAGSFFSSDPAVARFFDDAAKRTDDVLKDMRRALGRIRADQGPNTFAGALLSVF